MVKTKTLDDLKKALDELDTKEQTSDAIEETPSDQDATLDDLKKALDELDEEAKTTPPTLEDLESALDAFEKGHQQEPLEKSTFQKIDDFASAAIVSAGNILPDVGAGISRVIETGVSEFHQLRGTQPDTPLSETFAASGQDRRDLEQEALSRSPEGEAFGEIAGELALLFAPIPGTRLRLITKLGIEAGRGGVVSALTSDAAIGSAEWAIDVGLGLGAGAAGELASVGLKTAGKAIGKTGGKLVQRVTDIKVRDLQAAQRFSTVAAMQAKFHGREKILLRIPLLRPIVKAIDDVVINVLKGKQPRNPLGQFKKT